MQYPGTLVFLLICAALMQNCKSPDFTADAKRRPGPGMETNGFPVPRLPFAPKAYICYRASRPLAIDGRLLDVAWQRAPWTDYFVDIEGDLKPKPRFRTRVKMLWDERYFYAGAELEEPHLWATLTQRDTVIYYDNDFEVFIDPDGDTHHYFELELNALGTVWDLFLVRPYRDGGPAMHAWDISGLLAAVHLQGTLNNPRDRDTGWTVEIAVPWTILREAAPEGTPPKPGSQWRVNFSRVEWQSEVISGKYCKRRDAASGKPLPEDNWVWSPQGLVNMHYPEMWGYVQFSDSPPGTGEEFVVREDEQAKWALRLVYYAQRAYQARNGRFAAVFDRLHLPPQTLSGYQWPPELRTTWHNFEARLPVAQGTGALYINHEGRIFRSPDE